MPDCDVAVIGGGPAGSTAGALLRKYDPSLKVVILERERFPRDHVGESLLPVVCEILDEMGCWRKVEDAGFPVKIGATYRWGSTDDLWDFDLIEGARFRPEPRPGEFRGQRRRTAWQVDRSVFDSILLDHARGLGCHVEQEVKITRIEKSGDRIDHCFLKRREGPSDVLTARHYVDATGGAGVVRRAMGVEIDSPTALRNVAIWDYWQNAEWAVTLGNEGTRILIMSLGYGWLWFIPIGSTRTSIGLVIPADRAKASGDRPEKLYLDAISREPLISNLVRNAQRECRLSTTKDWSYVAQRLSGENWFLAGDSCGFADPILSAGLTLAMSGARQVAYSILGIEGGQDAEWLKAEYSRAHRARIHHHIRFADFWYTSNSRFTDLKAYCSEIAKDAGLELDADKAFQWLGTGGFAHEFPGAAYAVTYNLAALKHISQHFTGTRATWTIARHNVLKLNLQGARREKLALLVDGRVIEQTCFRRGSQSLPLVGLYKAVAAALQQESDATKVARIATKLILDRGLAPNPSLAYGRALEVLEALVTEGWITTKTDRSRPMLPITETPKETAMIHRNVDTSADSVAVDAESRQDRPGR